MKRLDGGVPTRHDGGGEEVRQKAAFVQSFASHRTKQDQRSQLSKAFKPRLKASLSSLTVSAV